MSIINVNPGDVNHLIQVNSSYLAGDEIRLTGTYQLGGRQLYWPRSCTLNGQTVGGNQGKLVWTSLPKAGNNSLADASFGMLWGGNLQNVLLTRVAFDSNNGIHWIRPGSSNFQMEDCDLKWGSNGNYYNRHAYVFESGAGGHTNPRLENNYFHDSPSADRITESWNCNGFKFRWNRVHDCNDLGHFMDFGGTFDCNENYVTQMHRMILGEMQNPCHGVIAQWLRNVCVGTRLYWNDTFGVSCMGWDAASLLVQGNYWLGTDTYGQGHGTMGQGIPPRLGIIVEASGRDGQMQVKDNVAGGPFPWFNFVAASGRGCHCQNNKHYGTFAEPAMLEPEPHVGGGSGSIIDDGGNEILPYSQMPPASQFLALITHPIGPRTSGGGGDPDPMSVAYTNPQLQPNGGASVIIQIRSIPTGCQSVKLEARATGDPSQINTPHVAPTPIVKALSPGQTSIDILLPDIHPGWSIDVLASGLQNNIAVATAGWLKVPTIGELPGDPSTEPWPPVVQQKRLVNAVLTFNYSDGTTRSQTMEA